MPASFPPPEKIYEAWSAIASGRVRMQSPSQCGCGEAEVTSSDGVKAYNLRWNGNEYESSDNATYWQGYPGYPILAVLMLQGRLPYNPEIAALFRGIDWKAANRNAKGDYALALKQVLGKLALSQEELEQIHRAASEAMEALRGLDISCHRYRKRSQC